MGVPEKVRGRDSVGDERAGELCPEIRDVAEEVMLVERDHIEDGAATSGWDDIEWSRESASSEGTNDLIFPGTTLA